MPDTIHILINHRLVLPQLPRFCLQHKIAAGVQAHRFRANKVQLDAARISARRKDKIVFKLIKEEAERQTRGIELIASENYVSEQVMKAMGSVLTNKYAEGLPFKRYYGGCEVVDQVEQLAIDRAKTLFGAAWVNVQPHSGAQANMSVFLSFLELIGWFRRRA